MGNFLPIKEKAECRGDPATRINVLCMLQGQGQPGAQGGLCSFFFFFYTLE